MCISDGSKQVGELKDGLKNGQGIKTYADGLIEGNIWEVGNFEETAAEILIDNACLVNNGPCLDMSVCGLEKVLKATCASITGNPSFLEGLRYKGRHHNGADLSDVTLTSAVFKNTTCLLGKKVNGECRGPFKLREHWTLIAQGHKQAGR